MSSGVGSVDKHRLTDLEINLKSLLSEEEKKLLEDSALNPKKKGIKNVPSTDFRPKGPSAKWWVIASAVTLIVLGLIGFIGVPFVGAAHLIPIHAYILIPSIVGGLILMILGALLWGRCTPKSNLPPDRSQKIENELEEKDKAKKAKESDTSKTISTLGLETTA